MRSLTLVLLAVTATALGTAGGARAAGWSAPVTVSASHTFAQPVALTQSSASVLATWGWQDGTGAGAVGGFSAAAAPAGASFAAELPAPSGIVDVAPYGSRRAVAVTQTDVPASVRGATSYRLAVSFAEDGRFGPAQPLVTGPVVSQARIASAGGPVIVGWIQIAGRRRIVKVVTRAPGGTFSAPVVLSGRGQADVLDVAASRRGDLAVLFVRNGRVMARVKRAGHGWGAVRELARADGRTQWQLMSAIAENGRVVAAWRRYTLRHDGVAGTRALESSYMAAGSSVFSVPQVVERDGVVGPTLLAREGSGFALAWTDQDGIVANGPATASVALTEATARFGTPLRPSAGAVGGLRDVRMASGPGGLYVVWVEPQALGGGDGRGRGALLPAGAAAFGSPEAVTPDENVHEVGIAADVTGRAFIAAWSARPEGTGPGIPVAQLRSVVRAARRT